MSKTNHRVNKDREGRHGEAKAHKLRRDSALMLDDVIDRFNYGEFEDETDLDLEDEFLTNEDYIKAMRIRK